MRRGQKRQKIRENRETGSSQTMSPRTSCCRGTYNGLLKELNLNCPFRRRTTAEGRQKETEVGCLSPELRLYAILAMTELDQRQSSSSGILRSTAKFSVVTLEYERMRPSSRLAVCSQKKASLIAQSHRSVSGRQTASLDRP